MGIGIVDLLLVAVALSMDAFAVAVSSGIVSDSPNWKNIVKLAFFFGFFQFLMPVIGWLLGNGVSIYIEKIDHWVAFGLLAFIGVRMIIEVAKGGYHRLRHVHHIRYRRAHRQESRLNI